MPESSSVDYDEDEEEPESEDESGGATSNSEDEEEELCSPAGSPHGNEGPACLPGILIPPQPPVLSLRNRITSKSSVQPGETFLPGAPKMPARPMMEQIAGSNIWYQAYILRESKNEVKVRFPPYDCEDEERVEWVRKSSSRIWRGSYRNSQWKHLGRGSWAPKAQPKRHRRRPASSKQTRTRRQCSRQNLSDTTADDDTGVTGTFTDDGVTDGQDVTNALQHQRSDHETLSVLRKALKHQQQLDIHHVPRSQQLLPGSARHQGAEPAVAEEHSERGHIARGNNDCLSGGVMVSNKDNCDRTSAKSNPSEFKGIFSCSEPEDQGAEFGVDQAEYDPLTKWFEVHFLQLHIHGKVPRSFPHGTPEAGVLPAGFLWHNSGVVYAPTISSSGEAGPGSVGNAEAAPAVSDGVPQVKLEPDHRDVAQVPSHVKEEYAACERAAKLRRLHMSTFPAGGSDKTTAETIQHTQVNQVAEVVTCMNLSEPSSPGMSPGASAAVITMLGGSGFMSHDMIPSPEGKDDKTTAVDGPPGGSSQSESDVLQEKHHTNSSRLKVERIQISSPVIGRDGGTTVKSCPSAHKSKSLQASLPGLQKAKRKRAVIVSDDEDDDLAHVYSGMAVSSQTSNGALRQQHSEPFPSVSKVEPTTTNGPPVSICCAARSRSLPNALKSHSSQAPGTKAKLCSSLATKTSDRSAASSYVHLMAASGASNQPAPAAVALRKPPFVNSNSCHKGTCVLPPDTLQQPKSSAHHVAVRCAVPLKPASLSNGRASFGSGLESVRNKHALPVGHDRCNPIFKHSLPPTSTERMLPHKKAHVTNKLAFSHL